MKIFRQHSYVFAGFLVLWLSMLYPSNSSIWVWVATAGIAVALIIFPQIYWPAGSSSSRQWIWTVSAFCGVSVFLSIIQMLEYPIIRGVDSEVPWWENQNWARAGGAVGLPITFLAWTDLGSNDRRYWILFGSTLAWSSMLVPAFAALLFAVRQLPFLSGKPEEPNKARRDNPHQPFSSDDSP
jgi:hypothetical protein